MPSIHVYEPALCCNTGVCGPDPAQELVTFTADLAYLKGRGADIARHNLASDTRAFADSATVRGFLEVSGSEGLPLVVVDGVTVLTGRYPTRDELVKYAGLAPEKQYATVHVSERAPASGGCCGSPAPGRASSSGGCCGSSPVSSACC